MNKKSISRSFIEYLFKRIQEDKGFAARMRKADNPATEYQCWDTLASFDINLEFTNQRLPFTLVAAAIARSDQAMNGDLKIGQALALAFDDGNKNEQAIARLRRLLACSDIEELFHILRPLIRLVQSRKTPAIDYISLLDDLRWFYKDSERVKARWAQHFYKKEEDLKQEDA